MNQPLRLWICSLAAIGFFICSKDVGAQENAGVIRFSAVVQHVGGSVVRVVDGTKTEPLGFKSVIYENERLLSETNAIFKILSRHECIAVLYGEGQATAPAGDRPWQIKTQAVRWICPDGASETFAFHDSLVLVQPNSEILVDGKRFFILKGNARLTGPPSRPTKTESYSFNQEFLAPRESTPLEKPKVVAPPLPPPKPKTIRLVLTPLFGSTRLKYDPEDLDKSGVKSNGARLQAQLKRTSGSFIAAVSYREADDNQSGEYVGTPPDGVRARSQLFSLELGYRFQHDRWWSPYLRTGVGSEKSKINVNFHETTTSYFSDIEYEFNMLTGAAGVDALYSPSWANWIGVYGALEIELARSVSRGAKSVKNEFCQTGNQICLAKPAAATEPTGLTSIGPALMFGGFVQF